MSEPMDANEERELRRALTRTVDRMRVTVPVSPFLDALVTRVQAEHGLQGFTYGQALAWIIEDCVFVLDRSVPAYGRWSPALGSMIQDAVRDCAAGLDRRREQP